MQCFIKSLKKVNAIQSQNWRNDKNRLRAKLRNSEEKIFCDAIKTKGHKKTRNMNHVPGFYYQY